VNALQSSFDALRSSLGPAAIDITSIGPVFALFAAIFAGANLYLNITKPKVVVRFASPNTLTRQIEVFSGEPATLPIVLRNEGGNLLGAWSIKKPAANRVSTFMYFDPSFDITGICRYENREMTHPAPRIFFASPTGRFAGRKYVAIPSMYNTEPPAISVISYSEDVLSEVSVIPPAESGAYSLFVQITSTEGHLGVHELKIIVRDRPALQAAEAIAAVTTPGT
jgi:hypothetical protein